MTTITVEIPKKVESFFVTQKKTENVPLKEFFKRLGMDYDFWAKEVDYAKKYSNSLKKLDYIISNNF
jgi:hypothetical protein